MTLRERREKWLDFIYNRAEDCRKQIQSVDNEIEIDDLYIRNVVEKVALFVQGKNQREDIVFPSLKIDEYNDQWPPSHDPEDIASFLSYLIFAWVNHTFFDGLKNVSPNIKNFVCQKNPWLIGYLAINKKYHYRFLLWKEFPQKEEEMKIQRNRIFPTRIPIHDFLKKIFYNPFNAQATRTHTYRMTIEFLTLLFMREGCATPYSIQQRIVEECSLECDISLIKPAFYRLEKFLLRSMVTKCGT